TKSPALKPSPPAVRRLQRLVRLAGRPGQFVAVHRRNIRAEQPIHELGSARRPRSARYSTVSSAAAFFGNGSRDKLVDRDVILLGKLPNLTVSEIGKPETQAAHASSQAMPETRPREER